MDVEILLNAPWFVLGVWALALARWGIWLWAVVQTRRKWFFKAAFIGLNALAAVTSVLISAVEPEIKKGVALSLFLWTVILAELTLHATVEWFLQKMDV